MKKLMLIWLVFVLAASVSALDVDTYNAAFNIVGNTAVVEIDILFSEDTTDSIEFELPEDYTALSVYIDDETITPFLEDNILKIELNKSSKISFNYVTREFVDKTNFLMNMKLDFNVDELEIKLVLPEGASLKKPIKEGDLTSGSIYPKPTKATTDGRNLVFFWEYEHMQEGDEASVFTQIELKKEPYILIIALVLLGIIVIGLFFYILKKKPRIIVKKEDMVEKHLKEDEEQIINVLKRKEGSCEQGTLRVVTGFSKATLSRLLSELEARKVVYKEKRGKKNVVFLRK